MKKIYSVLIKNRVEFYLSELDIKNNFNVVVKKDNKEFFGKVVNRFENKIIDTCGYIDRISSKEDLLQHKKNQKLEGDAEVYCKDSISKLNLDMRLIDVVSTLDKKLLTFVFYSDNRIDFRELTKILSAKYKTRIELYQIGARDKAKEVSGYGCCGQKLCCSRFLNELNSVSINMAKNQNLPLNPTKINGACGRLLCCLAYEDNVYSKYKKDLPRINQEVVVDGRKGIVKSLDILRNRYVVKIDKEYITVDLNEDSKE